jgi:hypothetical protein
MLFDLRSRRRRNTVKLVYGGLALLIGLGLVGFGIGTGGNFGGLLNAAGSGGGGSGTGDQRIEKQLTQAQKHAKKNPGSAAAWLAVGDAAYAVAELPTNYVQNSGFTKSGFAVLKTLKNAWTRYLALSPAKPSLQLANAVVVTFGPAPTGIQDWATAESAQEVVVEQTPTYSQYEYLAYFAYAAKEVSRGDLAAARAVALAPKAQKTQIQKAVANLRKSLIGATGATGSTSSSTTTSSGATSSATSSSHTSG